MSRQFAGTHGGTRGGRAGGGAGYGFNDRRSRTWAVMAVIDSLSELVPLLESW